MGDSIPRVGHSSVDGSAEKTAKENRLSVAGKARGIWEAIRIAKAFLGVLCALACGRVWVCFLSLDLIPGTRQS
jgi:hypothetical protein